MGASNWRRDARTVLAQQDWALLILIFVCAVGIGICEFKAPVQRPVFLYDATISYANKPNTIEDYWAPLIPAIVFVFSLALVECYLFRKSKVATAAAFLRFFMAGWAALMVVGFLTELFKIICGRLRPDFLDRCKPAVAPGEVSAIFDAVGTGDTWGTNPRVTCTADDDKFLRDGRVSFPSGHSSTAYVVGWFGCFYLIWGTSVRSDHQMSRRLYRPHDSALRRVGKELLSCLLLVLQLFQLSYPWGVGVSRFRDNRHNASDIVAGFMLGVTFAPALLWRAIGQHDYWLNYYGIDESQPPSNQVIPAGSNGDAGGLTSFQEVPLAGP
ncbi:hypothetical protein MNEG_2554 [Monoraphidium neglectum]|uniref:Phosphatidic acid phosphatase type 2/haloperoxidase domain-containing protein n=1 Tax=Monoraphidium neglectum TaxID=145388 RepID=A0A0D2K4L7_9CHLO|nr:hypothetical protein MNEG_2554 [Monoraphidium neglectum]KIZ05403.1 hypothetical protein MNEG_2554 [Monoraphidium neglectum]|eukprot:XP_013904422.1 hypothetical protein MNEG_2554 [Monoraphidium neglectum]